MFGQGNGRMKEVDNLELKEFFNDFAFLFFGILL